MRIALFTDTYPPQVNGVANSTCILRNQLEKHGHEVYVVTPFKGTGQHEWSADHKILYLAGMELESLYGYIMTSPVHMFALEEIRKLNLDIIHAQTEFGVGIFARICAKQLKVPLVSTYHTTYEDYTHYVNFINSKTVDKAAKAGVAKVSKLYGDSSMEVIAPSEKTKDMLLGYKIRREINVIPTGLELDQYSPSHADPEKRHAIRQKYGFRDEDRLFIYVGRIAEEKSLDVVIHGVKKARDQGISVQLLVVGSGPDEESIRKMSEDEGLAKEIRFAGQKPASQIPDYYRAADVFVNASLTETQGMTFIEAEASGLPILARYDKVLDNVIIPGKTGMFFRDEEDLAAKLKQFIEMDEDTLAQMQADCIENVKPYSAETFYERVMQVYERVIKEYEYQFEIIDTISKDNAVQLYLISNQKEEMRLQVSLDDYYNYGMHRGGILIKKQVNELKRREEGVIACGRCMHRIAIKDRTRKEIYDWLMKNTECDTETINSIVEYLEDKGYIDDDRYCDEAIRSLKAKLFGKIRIVRYLEDNGIRKNMIEDHMGRIEDDEYGHAIAYAKKIFLHQSHESTQRLKDSMLHKLMRQGYSSDIASEVVSNLDFSENESHEVEHLKRSLAKAKKQYEKKYQGLELRKHLIQYCLRQGYQAEDIYAAIDEMEL